MIEKLKPGKISIVVFLTALIWVWADLALDEPLPLSDVKIEMAKPTDPSLWVNFLPEGPESNPQTAIALDTVVLKGPASTIAEVSRQRNRGKLDLTLFLVPEQEGLTHEEVRTVNVLDFLRRNLTIRQLGLSVESCVPETLMVQVRKLVEQPVDVECIGIDSSQVPTLNPPSVMAYVPAGETVKAIVQLNAQEQNQAKTAPVEKTPYIRIAGQQWPVPTKVKVTLAPAQNVLTPYPVPATYSFGFSPNLQGKYRVVLAEDTDPTALTSVSVKATPLACDAYRAAGPQLILYIRDQDAQAPPDQWIERDFEFHFPAEYVRKGEIEANQPPPKARFMLVPIATETAPHSEL